jgi:hypothetical protein
VTDQAALFGIAGAISGAALGAGATLAVPFLTHRNSRRDQRHSRVEDEFQRLMELRSTSRALVLFLDDARQRVLDGERVDRHKLWESFDEAVSDMRAAADRCEIYGLKFLHTRSTPEMRARRRGVLPPPETQHLRELVALARHAAAMVVEVDAREGGDVSDDDRGELATRQEGAERARRLLLGVVMDRLDELREEMSEAG